MSLNLSVKLHSNPWILFCKQSLDFLLKIKERDGSGVIYFLFFVKWNILYVIKVVNNNYFKSEFYAF